MQKYLVEKSSKVHDMLYDKIMVTTELPYVLHDSKSEKAYDCTITSAHVPTNYLHMRAASNKMVAVVSYVPSISNNTEWASFYVNLVMCDAIACSRFIHNQLQKITIPAKRWINLDGCTMGSATMRAAGTQEGVLDIFNADTSQQFWEHFEKFVNRRNTQNVEEHGHNRYRIVKAPHSQALSLAFNPVCPTYATFLAAHSQLLLVGAHEDSTPFMDCRQVHKLNIDLQHLLTLIGSAGALPIQKNIEGFMEEHESMLAHLTVNKTQNFHSNVSIYDRIFHSINREM